MNFFASSTVEKELKILGIDSINEKSIDKIVIIIKNTNKTIIISASNDIRLVKSIEIIPVSTVEMIINVNNWITASITNPFTLFNQSGSVSRTVATLPLATRVSSVYGGGRGVGRVAVLGDHFTYHLSRKRVFF